MSEWKKSSVLVLFGPTGVGKTQLLTESFTGEYEIVSADSMQVYTGMDIGTAKPTPRQRAAVPHHLIDILHPSQQYTVGDFVQSAKETVYEIQSRSRIPVVSGGTAFYFKHLLLGLPQAPSSDPKIQQALEYQARTEGTPHLYERLQQVDPVSAARIHPADSYRIIRALEVHAVSGRPLSDFGLDPATGIGDEKVAVIGLTRPREELRARIAQRVDQMFSEGLIDEVASLIDSGARSDWPGMRGIGYREFFTARESGELTYADVREQIIRHSIQYAKRQMTFFRSLPDVHWFDAGDTEGLREFIHTEFA